MTSLSLEYLGAYETYKVAEDEYHRAMQRLLSGGSIPAAVRVSLLARMEEARAAWLAAGAKVTQTGPR